MGWPSWPRGGLMVPGRSAARLYHWRGMSSSLKKILVCMTYLSLRLVLFLQIETNLWVFLPSETPIVKKRFIVENGSGQGQLDDKPAPFTGCGDHIHATLVIVRNNKVSDRKPQARAFAHGLGGKERIKDPLADLFRHARAVIGNFYYNALICFGNNKLKPGLFRPLRVPDLLHGFGAVFEDIEEYLLQLAGLTGNLGQPLFIAAHHLDGPKVILFFQVIVTAGQFQGLVQDLGNVLEASSGVVFPGKAEHILYNLVARIPAS